MATPQLSPGVLTREVDLTVGRAENVLDNIGAIAGPFPIGPIDDPIDISTEEDLINVFGKPLSTDAQYAYWMSAASYLGYGGVLKVCRTDSTHLNNANAALVLHLLPHSKLRITTITKKITASPQLIHGLLRTQVLGLMDLKFVSLMI